MYVHVGNVTLKRLVGERPDFNSNILYKKIKEGSGPFVSMRFADSFTGRSCVELN
jgi:hypothetical protein